MNVVLFLSGQSMGDALGAIGRSCRRTFEELGYEFIEVNFGQPDAGTYFNSILKERKIEFAFSFVGMCNDLVGGTDDGKRVNLWEGLGIPFISLYGDSPAYYFDRHVVPSGLFACLYAFPEHYALRKRLPAINGLIGTLPPAPLDVTAKSSLDFAAKERGPLLFLKNGNDPQKLLASWHRGLPVTVYEMLAELATELVGTITTTLGDDIDALVCRYFLDKGLDIEAVPKLRLFFTAQLDDYLRRVKSTSIAELLLDFPIEVHGYNWEHVDFSGRRAKLVHGGDYTKSRSLVEGALGVLDMSPNTSGAPHERASRAFGMYTLCLTNEQRFFSDRFPQHQLFTFRFEGQSLKDKVADVLAHPKRYVELGIEVAETFRSNHSPLDFGKLMLETAGSIRLAWAGRPPGLQNFFAWPPSKLP
jgi:hypothetical protein